MNGVRAEGWAKMIAEKHVADVIRGGCICGFCVWSAEHVVVMTLRELLHRGLVEDRSESFDVLAEF